MSARRPAREFIKYILSKDGQIQTEQGGYYLLPAISAKPSESARSLRFREMIHQATASLRSRIISGILELWNIRSHLGASALAQTTRLETFRLLVARRARRRAAGELARLMAVPQNTMSAHLSILAHAGLVTGERQSRSIIYRRTPPPPRNDASCSKTAAAGVPKFARL